MTHRQADMVRRFTARHVVNHWIMLVCFVGLVLTGVPQKFPAQEWAKGLILLFGGVVRVRFMHHLLGTVMALQLVWHVVESVWRHLVRRLPMSMIPRVADVQHFLQQVRFNVGFVEAPPAMDRYTFAEKLEYLALVWGTAVMVATGLLLLYPVRWSLLVPGEVILAAKAAHGGEAILAFLSILTWHVYFVHIRHWNTAIFTGRLGEEAYAEEHSLELARIRRGDMPLSARPAAGRVIGFALITLAVVGGVLALMWWLRWSPAAVAAVTIAGRG